MLGGINDKIGDRNMKDFFSKDNILIQASSDDDGGQDKKKSKKGDGINAVLVLMKELRDFQDRVEACLEAQDIEDIAAKIRSFDTHLDEMYGTLLDIASNGIKSVRRNRSGEGGESQYSKPPVMMGVPTVPKI